MGALATPLEFITICKMIETTGSLIERLLPKSIHAVTTVGFELKVSLFILAMSFNLAFKVAT